MCAIVLNLVAPQLNMVTPTPCPEDDDAPPPAGTRSSGFSMRKALEDDGYTIVGDN